MNAKRYLEEADVDAIIIYNGQSIDLNFYYFTRLLYGGIFEGSFAVVTDEGVKVITSPLEEQSAKKGNNEVIIYRNKVEREELIKKTIEKAERIGLNYGGLTIKDFENIKDILGNKVYVDISEKILQWRMIKDEEEYRLIKEAAKIASEVADIMPDFIREGMKEYELAARLAYEMFKRGAEDLAFTSIVAFGENSAEPHYISGSRKLKKGDFVLIDFGAKYKHYNSDITRTFVFGRATQIQKDMYYTVLEAQEMAINMIKEGVNGKEVDIRVKEYINSTQFKDRMIHSTGHGLGLAVHDHIGLTSLKDMILKERMVVTVEPGIYIPGKGGVRIEDDIFVRKDGAEILTYAKKSELIEIS